MFRSTYLRLTMWYVLIIMAISILFSAWVYNEANKELSAGLERQGYIIRQQAFDDEFGPSPSSLQQIRDQQLADSRAHILLNLIYFNIVVLAGGAAASYWLAKRTMQPLRESMEAQHRFTADASHELRTPLAAMRAEIEVALRDKKLTLAEARALFNSNLEEINKLEALSGSLLSLAQHQQNQALSFKKVRLQPLVTKTVKSLTKVAAASNITITQEVKSSEIEADEASLQEVLRILLDNAIKYSPNGGEIIVRAWPEGQWAIIEVEDHGIGIKASAIPHVFERFYREDSSRTKGDIQGFGLGLSIAKGIVDGHNGSIAVASTPQKGSTFTVKLPIARKD